MATRLELLNVLNHNKLFKSDSQRVAFSLCVVLSG